MVLVDSSHPEQRARFSEFLPSESPDESRTVRLLRHGLDPSATPERIDFRKSAEQVRTAPMLGLMPLVVLSQSPNALRPPGFAADIWDKMRLAWAELQADLFEGFGSAMRNGLMMVYAVLVLLFGSLLQPLTILFSLPLSIGGAILALLVTNLPLTTPVVIGMLMLMGIVTKNAIMLVDFAIEAIQRGVDRNTAIIEAGQKRARPIVMTTIAMTAGMMPSALAFGAGGELRSPMAIGVIGGLLVSTLLSLLFVPAFFTLMDDLGYLGFRMFGRFIGKADEPAPAGATKAASTGDHPSGER